MKSQNKVLVKKVSSKTDIRLCLAIRHQVFIEGQQIPIHDEVDGLDSSSEHYLLFHNKLPVGTARVRYTDDFAKIERVAILENHQGQGLGNLLMHFIIDNIQQHHQVKKIKLGSQTHAIPFYEKFGFIVCSDEYLEAGIAHKDMQFSFK